MFKSEKIQCVEIVGYLTHYRIFIWVRIFLCYYGRRFLGFSCHFSDSILESFVTYIWFTGSKFEVYILILQLNTLGQLFEYFWDFGLIWCKMVFETHYWWLFMTFTWMKYANFWFKDFRISAVGHFSPRELAGRRPNFNTFHYLGCFWLWNSFGKKVR